MVRRAHPCFRRSMRAYSSSNFSQGIKLAIITQRFSSDSFPRFDKRFGPRRELLSNADLTVEASPSTKGQFNWFGFWWSCGRDTIHLYWMKKSAWLLVYFTFFWAFFLDFIESKPFSYRHFRLFQQALSRVCGKKFVGGVRSRSSVVRSRSFQALLPSLFVPVYVLY